ncbi:MAG: hypothetical protein PHF17_05010 [Arcobacteraceae bacterium]|nr:hypothetical protein [Arcobacteraceae bacterium]
MSDLMKYIELAKNTTDILMQKDFAKSSEMFIRKALASNPFISSEIANELAYDKAVNVSYEATRNKNCTITRIFRDTDVNHRCVLCNDVLNDITNCQRC